FHDGVQATGTDVLGALVHLPGGLRNARNAVRGEADFQAFGSQQRLVLFRQRTVRLGQDTFEIVGCQRFQLHADGQTSLQFRYQVRWFGQMKRAGGNEQDVVCLHAAVFRGDRRTFDQWQQVTLYAFPGDTTAAGVVSHGDLVDLVDEHDA